MLVFVHRRKIWRRTTKENKKMKTAIMYAAFAAVTFTCFGLLPMARAVMPAPDGGYPLSNTAEGTDALFSLTTGVSNTALGFDALYSNTTGFQNTATGAYVLLSNTTGGRNTAGGETALAINTEGSYNTAIGFDALFSATASGNTATGYE